MLWLRLMLSPLPSPQGLARTAAQGSPWGVRLSVAAPGCWQGAEASPWRVGSCGPAMGDRQGPLQGRPQVLAWLPPRAWGHLPTVVPGAVRQPGNGQQDEEAEPIHGCQRHVSAASTEGSGQQHSHSRSARSGRAARGALGPGADVTEGWVPCPGHCGLWPGGPLGEGQHPVEEP